MVPSISSVCLLRIFTRWFTPKTINQYLDGLESDHEDISKTIIYTFDDGYLDNYTNAHKVLCRFNAKATLYLVADRFDRDWSSSKK